MKIERVVLVVSGYADQILRISDLTGCGDYDRPSEYKVGEDTIRHASIQLPISRCTIDESVIQACRFLKRYRIQLMAMEGNVTLEFHVLLQPDEGSVGIVFPARAISILSRFGAALVVKCAKALA